MAASRQFDVGSAHDVGGYFYVLFCICSRCNGTVLLCHTQHECDVTDFLCIGNYVRTCNNDASQIRPRLLLESAVLHLDHPNQ